ncbi:TPA: hypothetical protein ACIE3C_001743, partial [Streptococcus pyogenes]
IERDRMEIVHIKDIVTEPYSADDETLGKIFGYTKRQMQDRRYEMVKIPYFSKYLLEQGGRVTIDGMREYLFYRKSIEWEKDKEKYL